MANNIIDEAVALLSLDDREYELLCMLSACGQVLTLRQVDFCSQAHRDAYQEPDVEGMAADEWKAHEQDYLIRMSRVDRLRATYPGPHPAPIGWLPDENVG